MPFWSQSFQENVTLKDPKRKFRFTVQFTGINAANGGSMLWYAKTAGKPKFSVESVPHSFLNHEFHYPGSVKWEELSITMVDPGGDLDVASTLSAIVQSSGYNPPTDATNENLTSISKAKATGALGTVIITQIDSDGNPIETWTLWNAFVKDFQTGELSYGDDELTTATVELMYDWARVETTNPSVATAGGGTSFFNA